MVHSNKYKHVRVNNLDLSTIPNSSTSDLIPLCNVAEAGTIQCGEKGRQHTHNNHTSNVNSSNIKSTSRRHGRRSMGHS